MSSAQQMLDAAGRRRSPATMPDCQPVGRRCPRRAIVGRWRGGVEDVTRVGTYATRALRRSWSTSWACI